LESSFLLFPPPPTLPLSFFSYPRTPPACPTDLTTFHPELIEFVFLGAFSYVRRRLRGREFTARLVMSPAGLVVVVISLDVCYLFAIRCVYGDPLRRTITIFRRPLLPLSVLSDETHSPSLEAHPTTFIRALLLSSSTRPLTNGIPPAFSLSSTVFFR